MEVKEAVKIIKEGWVQRKKGYRVHLKKFTDSQWTDDYVPDMKEKSWTSEVSTWELARRMAVSVKPVNDPPQEGDIANITVVDDAGNPVNYYATNETKIYNQI